MEPPSSSGNGAARQRGRSMTSDGNRPGATSLDVESDDARAYRYSVGHRHERRLADAVHQPALAHLRRRARRTDGEHGSTILSAACARDVLGGRALLALHDVELDGLALGEGLEAVALNGRVMDEAVLLAVRGGDEAEALGVVEPLHGAGRTHGVAPDGVMC